MQFWQLVRLIKNNGCRVRLYNKDELRLAQCAGTFDITKSGNPLICIATKGHTRQELMQLLLHEYAHFLQWKSGFLHKLEGPDLKDGWDVFDKWFKRIKRYNDKQLKHSRNAIVLIEYDADLRVLVLAKELGIDIGSHKDYIANAYSYVTLIKWAFKNKKWGCHPDSGFSGKVRSPLEVLRPITRREEKIISDSQ